MTSYFDHFIVVKLITPYITDSFIILLMVVLMYLVVGYTSYLIPYRVQGVIELIVRHWITFLRENLGEKAVYYVLPITSLFFFIVSINVMGFFIYTSPPTTHISLTFGLAFCVWISVILVGFKNFRFSFFSIFMPSGAPLKMSPFLVLIEIVSNISRPLALGMRLAANLTAGHILLAILADFSCKLMVYSFSLANLFPIILIMGMTVLELGVLIIQAYVFCLLAIIYLKESTILH